MPTPIPFEVTFRSESNLEVRVPMAGPHHQFQTGKLGHYFIDQFDWNGKRWRLQFQAFVKGRQTETTHGMLEEVRARVPRVPSGLVLDTKPVGSLGGKWGKRIESARLNQERREAGWKLTKLPDGIQAAFVLSKLRTRPSGKMYSFASCNVEIEGVLYYCQFHLREQHEPMPKPTKWDWSRGARAGIPTLGKRR
jgi:hypothetical protein